MVFLKVLTIAAIAAVGMLASVGTQLTYGLGSINSQGVQAHQSDSWNQAGFSGEGIKVGIIESGIAGEGGFWGYQQLMGTELPTSVEARCYTRIGQFVSDIGICDTGDDHGTNVAETVADIAPAVSLYIANPTTAADLRSTVNWMVSEGVSVINHSAGWVFDGPPDGSWDYDFSIGNSVKRAMDAGIVWVNSAGNDARRTWFGPTTFTDGGEHFEFLKFQSNDFFNDIAMETGDRVIIYLRWDDNWAGARRDLDLSLWSHSEEERVAASLDYQNGLPGEYPIEILSFTAPRQGMYGILVSISVEDAPDKPNWAQLIVSSHDISEIESFTLAGSIINPAEISDPRMMAVGASHWADTHVLEPYSSRGPTPDGRVKPDIVGADCGATARRNGFCGTSQAAPHVAGMAALVRQRFPTYTAVQVANYLKEHAEQRESPDPNNTWGHGFAQLPPLSECSDAVPSAASNPGLVADCEALLAARDTLAGSGTLNWSGSTAIGSWDGVTVDGSPLRVTSLVLSDSQLTGTIPPELGNLNNLERLSLTRNQLTGDIPPELSLLTNLQLLALGGNQLSGEVPSSLGNITNLEELYLWGNQLTGPIPVGLGTLNNLRELSLGENQLTGMIPAELGSLTKLDWLYLSGNQLSGEVPSSLGSLANLQGLYLSDNQLSGEIPSELGSLANLLELRLNINQLTGTIPAELGSLANLQFLSLYGNQLSGEIPAELGSLANLEELWLYVNQLRGEIPAELGSLANLTRLALSQNQLSGEIPSELGSLANLLHGLHLDGNQLSGEIPAELGSLTNLQGLYLSDNQLSGEIPSSLGSLTDLLELRLNINQLTGTIPAELGSLANLQFLALSQNQLSGEIPSELGSLANLQGLYLSDNQLSGEIPSELGSLTDLLELRLNINQLTGTIPAELGSLANLQFLSLYGNQLSGEIPAELGSLANLEELLLNSNQLSGEIPSSLGSLANLQGLHLDNNQLSGEIPSELGSLANLQGLHLDNNQLSGEIPSELDSLTDLEELFLSGNQLTGCIPVGIAGVANNDFHQLGLPFCAGASGAPTIGTLTPGADFLTITWAAPTGSTESAIIAYDLRYIESAARDKSDVNWTVVDNAWTAGSGALSYQIAGLTDGTQYDVQVRAVSAAGDGPWSAAAAGTPATWGAIRSFSPPSVAPAGEVVVMITASGYGRFGAVTETLPPGFSYVSSSLEDSGVTDVGREVRFSLFGQTAFTYTVTAPGTEGTYSFSGVLRNSDREDVPVGGALTIAVAAGDPLIVRYDANGNGMIEKNEVIAAINDYLFGEGDEAISKSDVIKLINLYLFG